MYQANFETFTNPLQEIHRRLQRPSLRLPPILPDATLLNPTRRHHISLYLPRYRTNTPLFLPSSRPNPHHTHVPLGLNSLPLPRNPQTRNTRITYQGTIPAVPDPRDLYEHLDTLARLSHLTASKLRLLSPRHCRLALRHSSTNPHPPDVPFMDTDPNPGALQPLVKRLILDLLRVQLLPALSTVPQPPPCSHLSPRHCSG